MERKQFESAPCSIARTLDVIGDWWTPLIIRECLYGVHRFDALQARIGISRNILTRRLYRLVEQGILEKRPYQQRPQRFEYHLTEKGYDAARLLIAFMPFGDKWLFGAEGAPIELYERGSGRRVRPEIVDAETGQPLDVRRLYAGPGPGFPRSKAARRERFAQYYARADERAD
ncbi:MAG: helix-turn-helix transcriptional regulator [Myxococcales bacterium]|nr:helix-turn-helix transcriptional regulator [Myxococcales bacterium]